MSHHPVCRRRSSSSSTFLALHSLWRCRGMAAFCLDIWRHRLESGARGTLGRRRYVWLERPGCERGFEGQGPVEPHPEPAGCFSQGGMYDVCGVFLYDCNMQHGKIVNVQISYVSRAKNRSQYHHSVAIPTLATNGVFILLCICPWVIYTTVHICTSYFIDKRILIALNLELSRTLHYATSFSTLISKQLTSG